uniref:Uncharacterized protein n=1 Tax=Arundo donax TaxID=35708 RepID=A0A0A9CEV5_ARUDO
MQNEHPCICRKYPHIASEFQLAMNALGNVSVCMGLIAYKFCSCLEAMQWFN